MVLNSVLHSSSSFADVNFTALTGDRTRCDLSVVSYLKTGRMSCCCRQRRSCSDRPLTWGKTAVDLNSIAGSALVLVFLVLVSFYKKKKIGQSLKTITDDRGFFFLRGDDTWFCYETFGALVKTPNKTTFY